MKFKKTLKLFLFVFMMVIFIGAVNAAPSSIRHRYYEDGSENEFRPIGTITLSNGSTVDYYYHDTGDGQPLYCLNQGLNITTIIDYPLVESHKLTDSVPGYACAIFREIRDNNYNSDNDSNNASHKSLQKRLWETSSTATCASEVAAYSKETCVDGTPVKSGTTEGTWSTFALSKDSYTLSRANSKYYVSEKITVTTSSSYTFDLSTLPTGTYLTTSQACDGSNKLQSPSTTKNFYMCISSNQVYNTNLSYKLTLNGTIDKTDTDKYTTPVTCTTKTPTAELYVYRNPNGTPAETGMQDFAIVIGKSTTSTRNTSKEHTTPVPQTKAATTIATINIPTGSLKLLKKDSLTHKGVKDVTFKLYRLLDGNYTEITKNAIGEDINLVTDSSGTITINNLAYGTYKIEEVAPAPGYTFENIVVDNIIIENSTTKRITLENVPIKTVISKKAISGEDELPGAHIVITDTNGEVVHEFDSTDKPYEFVLGPGKYKLKETVAPKGYDKLETVFEFEIQSNGDVKLTKPTKSDNFKTKNNAITIYNDPTPVPVPDTGKMDILKYSIGLVIAILGVATFVIFFKRYKAEQI